MQKYAATIVAGDFNMSMWRAVPILRERLKVVNLLAFYVWERLDTEEVPEEEEEDDQTQAAATAASSSAVAASSSAAAPAGAFRVHSDSLALLLTKPVKKLERAFPDDVFVSAEAAADLTGFSKGQGYPLTSYQGRLEAAKESLRFQEASPVGETLPKCNQKKSKKASGIPATSSAEAHTCPW